MVYIPSTKIPPRGCAISPCLRFRLRRIWGSLFHILPSFGSQDRLPFAHSLTRGTVETTHYGEPPPPENPQLLPQPRQGWSRVSVTSREICQHSGQESNSEHLHFQIINNISRVSHAKSSLTPLTTCLTTRSFPFHR